MSTAYTWMFGEGEIHVVAGENSATVLMDGQPLGEVSALTTARFHVAQGGHELTITDDETGEAQTLSVSVGGWTEVIVTTPGQCMADLDVTDGIYNSSEAEWRLKGWHGPGEIASMPSNGGTSFQDLPEEIDQYARARLLVAVPCSMEGESEAINELAALRMVLETSGTEE